ncbi:hypothetical protein SABIM44S_04604 [Streptomyces abikoensis]
MTAGGASPCRFGGKPPNTPRLAVGFMRSWTA